MSDKEIYITIHKKDYDELLALKEGKSIKVIIHEDRFIQNYVMTTNKIVASMANKIKILNSMNHELNDKLSKTIYIDNRDELNYGYILFGFIIGGILGGLISLAFNYI